MAHRHITGIDKVLRNLNKEIQAIPNRTLKGLIRAGSFILADTEKISPKVPVDEGNLRNSKFLVTSKGGAPKLAKQGTFEGEQAPEISANHSAVTDKYKSMAEKAQFPLVIIGYTANYAWRVHEMVDGVNWNREGSGAKFLEASINRNKKVALALIRLEAGRRRKR